MNAEEPRRILIAGNVNIDHVLGPQTPWPQPGQEVFVPHSELRAGGAAGNAALALHALGTPLLLAASRGPDAFGQLLAETLGEVPALWRLSGRSTGISVGLTHPDGERTFFSFLGHLAEYGPGDTAPLLAQARPGEVLLVCGSFVGVAWRAHHPALLAQARALGVLVALDPGWPPEGYTPAVRAEVRGWLPLTEHLLINALEARALTGRTTDGDAAEALRDWLAPGGSLVIKQGPDGAAAWQAEAHCRVAAPAVQVVDTIGAGDTFNAGYLWALLRGEALEERVRCGTSVASAAISSSPRRYGRSIPG